MPQATEWLLASYGLQSRVRSDRIGNRPTLFSLRINQPPLQSTLEVGCYVGKADARFAFNIGPNNVPTRFNGLNFPGEIESQLHSLSKLEWLADAFHCQTYPATALREGREGQVIGTIVVNPAGVVEEVKISSGDPVLAAAVQSAVGHLRYAPFQLNNRSVRVAIPLQVTFRITRA